MSGLVHHLDEDKDASEASETKETKVVRKEVEEEQVDEVTTLRRTTIEEIEIKKTPANESNSDAQDKHESS